MEQYFDFQYQKEIITTFVIVACIVLYIIGHLIISATEGLRRKRRLKKRNDSYKYKH